MKTLKRILSLAVVLTMVMSLAAFASYNDVEPDADYAGAVELLTALEIFVGDDLGNFNPDKTITRAEMAAIVCRAKGLENAAQNAKGETSFRDVSADHWASGYVNIANQNGIIAGYGNGKFGPEDIVTYDQAIKMVVSALGFEPMAAQKGGWPTGYLVVANQYKISEGVSDSTRADVAVLVANALSTPMMDQTTYGADAEFEVLDGARGRDYRTLLTDMDIYIATGIVGDRDYDEIEFDITDDSEDFEFEEGDEKFFKINGSDIANYKLQNVDAYVEKSSRSSYKVIAIVTAVQGSSFTLLSDDIESYSSNKVEYFVDPANSSKTKTFKLESTPTVEYNKSTYSGSISELLLNEDDVELTFIENTGDNTYDAIVATKYLSARVEYVDVNKDKISIDGKTITLDFDDEDVTILLEDADGNKLELSDFEEDDVVAVVADNENIKNYIDYIRIIKLDNAVVRGTVDGTYTSNGEPYVIIDGDEFIDATGSSIEVGDEGLFFIGMTGKIIAFDGSSAVKDYAYILECALATANFSDDLWQVKLLTSQNGIVTYTLNEDASEYFENTYASYLDINTSAQSKQLYSTLSESQKAEPYRLITYKTNSRGYIKSFKPAYVSGKTTYKTISASKDEYNARTQMINGTPLEDNIIVFNLSASSADNTHASNINMLTDEGKYSGFVFANEDYEYCVMVVTSGEGSFDSEAGFAIATKVVDTNDSEDNAIVKVTIVQDEEEKVIYFNDDSDNRAGTDSAYENISVGDVFAYNAGSSGYVNEYVILGSVNNGLLNVNKAAYGEFDEDTEFIYGYISSKTARNTSKGQVISVFDGNENEVFVPSAANKYTYNDSGRNLMIETEDFMAEDVDFYDEDSGNASFVFVKLHDGSAVDIYSFNKRVNVLGAVGVELMINTIGTVEYSEACEAKIIAAEEAYASLSETEKANVSNYSTLTSARSTYNTLKAEAEAAAKVEADKAAAAPVITLIDAIGTVELTDDCKAKIEAAKAAYDALSEDEKAYVTNASVLTDAIAAYDALAAQAKSEEKVADVVALINAIGTVDNSTECKAKIDAARAAYDALNDAEKAQVGEDVVNILTSAEASYDALLSSAAVGEVILLIDSIGEVEFTDACKEKIDDAYDAYEALKDEEKAQVTNADVLTGAKNEYNSSRASVENVIELIDAIGTVEYTDECKADIEAAKAAYKALETEEKYAVSNYSKLAEAEIQYDALKEAAEAAKKLENDKAEAAKVDALIAEIGTVDATAASKAKIDAAESAYNALSADQKAYVKNAEAIALAKTAYTKAVEEAKIAEDKAEAAKVDALIAEIGTVDATAASKAKIDAAESAYNALSADQKAYVKNAEAIALAKTAYTKAVEEAKIAEDKAEAAKVEALIKAIGTVDASDASKAKIDAAENAYNALSADQKKYVTNYAVLTSAKTAYAKAVEQKKIAETKIDTSKIDTSKISLPKTEAKKLESVKIAPAVK